MLGKIEGRRRRGQQRIRWLDGITDLMDMSLSRSKANRVLTRRLTGHSKQPLLRTQENTLHMDIIRWSILKSD